MEYDLEAEKQEILRRYRGLLRAAKNSKKRAERKAIRKAFDVALEAHKDIRRKSGEPYICLLYTSPSPRDRTRSRMPSSA